MREDWESESRYKVNRYGKKSIYRRQQVSKTRQKEKMEKKAN